MSHLKTITDDALVQAYYEAPVVEDLIDRLAIDNRTTRQRVREALAALGCIAPETPRTKKASKKRGPATRIGHAKAKALYDSGLSDLKIGRALGMSQNAVYNWRKRNGLPSHAQIMDTENGHLPLRVDGKEYGHLLPFPRSDVEISGNVSVPPDLSQAREQEAALTLGGFRKLLAMCLPEALDEAELYLDGVPLLGLVQIVTSMGDGVPRVDVQLRRGE